MEALYVYIGLAALFGLFMAWGIGANDIAEAFQYRQSGLELGEAVSRLRAIP